jgi:hypothetical protein
MAGERKTRLGRREVYAPNEVRTRVSAMSPLHGDERAGERKTRLGRREVYAPNEVRTRVSALSPLHGDERAGEKKTRLGRREVYAPNEVRTRVSALRGLRPGPLDNGGGERRNFTISHRLRQLLHLQPSLSCLRDFVALVWVW